MPGRKGPGAQKWQQRCSSSWTLQALSELHRELRGPRVMVVTRWQEESLAFRSAAHYGKHMELVAPHMAAGNPVQKKDAEETSEYRGDGSRSHMGCRGW